jgi:hypothetical protein
MDSELQTAIRLYIRRQVVAGQGGKIWYAMMKNVKAAAIMEAMELEGGHITLSAETLGINRQSFRDYRDGSMTAAQVAMLPTLGVGRRPKNA